MKIKVDETNGADCHVMRSAGKERRSLKQRHARMCHGITKKLRTISRVKNNNASLPPNDTKDLPLAVTVLCKAMSGN